MAQLIKKASTGTKLVYVDGVEKHIKEDQLKATLSPELYNLIMSSEDPISASKDASGNVSFSDFAFDDSKINGNRAKAKAKEEAARAAHKALYEANSYVTGPSEYKSSGDIFLSFIKGDDGKYKLDRSASNQNAISRLISASTFDPSKWDRISGFKNFTDKNQFYDYVTKQTNPHLSEILNVLKEGVTKEEIEKYKDILNSHQIYTDKIQSTSTGDGTKPTAGTSAGIIGDHIVHDGNGGFRFSDAYSGLNTLISDYLSKNNITHGNLWLNNDFKKFAAKNNFDVSWIPEDTGLFRINGKYVLGSNIGSLTGNDKVAFDNWVADNKSTINGSNDRFVQYWDTYGPYRRNSNTDGNYQNALGEGDYYIDQTGYYRLPNGQRLYQVANKDYRSNDSNYGLWGHLKRDGLKYILVDANGNLISDNVDLSKLTPEDDNDKIEKYYTTGTESPGSLRTEGGRNLNILRDANGVADKGYGLLYDPETQRYYWMNRNFRGNSPWSQALNDDFKNESTTTADYAFEVDPRLAKYILDNWDNLTLGYSNWHGNTLEEIEDLIRMPWLRDLSFRDWGIWTRDNVSGDLKEIYKELKKSGYNFGGTSYNFDGGNRALYSLPSAKSRGHLIRVVPNVAQVESKQHGGTIYKPKEVTVKHVKPIEETDRKPGEAKTIGDGSDLTTQDWAEIAALGADLGSAVLAFVPGANIASAGVGAAGSVTDFIAQATKDGLDWGDVGRLALNLGLDAATLIPFAGGAAKAAKIANAIRKSKPLAKAINWIAGAASAMGAGRGIATAYENIVNGDDWTIEDIRTIVNGIRGITNLNNLRGSAIKKGEVTDSTVGTIGKDENAIQITKKEYDDIMALPKDQQAKKMAEYIRSKKKDLGGPKMTEEEALEEAKKIVEKLKDKNGKPLRGFTFNNRVAKEKAKLMGDKKSLSDEEVLNLIGFKPMKQKAETTWNPKTWDFWHRGGIKGNAEFKPGPDAYRNPNDLPWWNWNRRASMRDAKTNRNNPFFKEFAKSQTHPVMSLINDEYQMVPITGYYKSPITVNTYHNLLPWFTRDENVIENPDLGYYKPTVYYKKGGKVVKCDNGFKFNVQLPKNLQSGYIYNPLMSPLENVAAEMKYDIDHFRDNLPRTLSFGTKTTPILKTPDFGRDLHLVGLSNDEKFRIHDEAQGMIDEAREKSKKPDEKDPYSTGSEGNKFDWGMAAAKAIDSARLPLAIKGTHDEADRLRNGVKPYSLNHYKLENPRYGDTLAQHSRLANTRFVTNSLLGMKPTRDASLNLANRHMVFSQAYNNDREIAAKQSQGITQFEKELLTQKNAANKYAVDFANKSNAFENQRAARLGQIDAWKTANIYKSFDNAGKQLAYDMLTSKQAMNDWEYSTNQQAAYTKYGNTVDSLRKSYFANIKKSNPDLSDNEIWKMVDDNEDYQKKVNDALNTYKASISTKKFIHPWTGQMVSAGTQNISIPGDVVYQSGPSESRKKGGKLNYIEKVDVDRKKTLNKMDLESHKDILKEIKKDDTLYKLLLKLID